MMKTAGMEIDVTIDEPFQGQLEEDWLRRVARQVLVSEGAGDDVEMGLVVTGQEQIRQLNRDYRRKDEPTDVLAFALRPEENPPGSPPFITPPDGQRHLGEVVVSYPQSLLQAAEQGHPVSREVATLIIHGGLHLLGYDHQTDQQEAAMRAREAAILDQLEEAKA
ncbi:MAG: rRNA maturation RNase YbeY [Chloroflexota bacterium]